MMRALLVVNPNATATTVRTRDVLASALGSDLRIDVERTKSRGHAIELGAQAVEDGYELVVALGGDGTVNEVVNGLLVARAAAGPARPSPPCRAGAPTSSPAPSATRPTRWRRPASCWTTSARAGPGASRSAQQPASDAGDRWFTFNAGLGLDAEVVRRVDGKRKPSRQGDHRALRPQRRPALLPRHRPAAPGHHADRTRTSPEPTRAVPRPGLQRRPVDLLRRRGRSARARRRGSRTGSTCSG